jgi:LysR family glycine cleavage system transcriptional activator
MYPDIDLKLTTTTWSEPFGDDLMDIDVRYGFGDWDGEVTHLGAEYAIPVCHADYLAAFGKPPDIRALIAAGVIRIVGV